MSYTVIGDAVNLAARLEGLNKTFGTRVLLSEFVVNHHRGDGDELQLRSPPLSENTATLVSKRNSLFAHAAAAASDPFAIAFALRLLGRIQVVGKEEPVRVYEAVGLTGVHSSGLDEEPSRPACSGGPNPLNMSSSTAVISDELHSRASLVVTPGPGDTDMDNARPVSARRHARRIRRNDGSRSFSALLHAALNLSAKDVDAACESPLSLACTASEMEFCAFYSTRVVPLFSHGEYQQCLAALVQLPTRFPHVFVASQATPRGPATAATSVSSSHTASEAMASVEAVRVVASEMMPAALHPRAALLVSGPASAALLVAECERLVAEIAAVGVHPLPGIATGPRARFPQLAPSLGGVLRMNEK
jgi:hypothetical protein